MKCESLEVWKKAAALSADVYLHLEDCKNFGFKDQLTRSGLSVASNIAEGMERESAQEKKRFLDIARASLAEAKTQIYIGMKINYIETNKGREWIKQAETIAKMLTGLIGTVNNTANR